MNNISTNTKLMLILFVSALVVILVSVYSILSIRIADRNIVSIYNDRVLPLEQLKSVSDVYAMDVIVKSQKALYGKISWDSAVRVLNTASVRINKNWSDYLNTNLTPEETVKAKQAEHLKISADETIKLLINLLKSKNAQNELTLKQTIEDKLYQNVEPLILKIDELILIQSKESNNLKSLTEKVFNKIILLTILVAIMCFLMIWLFRYKNRLEKIILTQSNELANANDELNAANEELLATNEELDAANEELYSTNEEYMMLNEQLEEHKNHLEILVTERIKELKESEDRYHTLVDNIMIPFIVSTFEGEILFVNPKGIEFTGANPNELQIFRTTHFWVDPLKRLSLLEQVKTNGFVKNEEVQLYNSLGKKTTVILSSNLINYYGQTAFFTVFNDISERKKVENALKESEERFRVTFEKAGIPIALVDMTGKPIKSNPKLQEMLGYSEDELALIPLIEFTHPDDIHMDWDRYTALINGNIDSYQLEKRYIRKDGRLIWGNLTVSLVRSPEGKPMYAIGMVEDITHKKDMERQILTSVINTEEHERLHFSQELHDGLGPLISAIKMYVQLLALPDSKMKPAEIISNIERLIEEASNSIREISFKLSPHVLLNYGIIEALNSYIEKVKESNRIAIELTSENFCRFSDIIETVLYRVICECINNSLKHARAQKINIMMKCINDEIDIIYKDDGQGFDVGKAMEEHKGIGLMNMQSRIKSVNGIMNIDSEPKQGVTIGIKLQAEVIKNIS